ncbi:MAG: hypothetical protein KDC79_12795 [Cyclobacteriaceae bacterium]|nr:hypothetical protein [Cyclobacteriaceae bacterium]
MNEAYRNISLIFEVERAIKFLRLGLSEIQKISAANDFYDPVFIYLSSGLERLFKAMLCLNHKELNKRFPKTGEIWDNKNGHDILFLKQRIEEICILTPGDFAQNDLDSITKNSFINSICLVLSEYGSKSRYFNLDAVLGKKQEFDSKKEWEKLETQVCKELYGEANFLKMLGPPNQLDKVYEDSNKEIIIRLETFFRALARQFVFGNFSSEANTYYHIIQDFSNIEDEQLGLTDYASFKNDQQIKRSNL